MKKVANFLCNTKNKIALAINSLAITAMLAMNDTALAVQVNTATANNKAKSIADVLVNIFPLMGAFFVLSGVVKWVMAFRSEQPEQQASAVKEIIIGVVCIVFRAFLWGPISGIVFS